MGKHMAQSLTDACRHLARTTTGSASADLVETVAASFEECARCYERKIAAAGQTDDVLVASVNYINEVLAWNEVGSDVRWFDATLEAVLEIIIPSRASGPAAIRFRSMALSMLANSQK